MTTKNKFVTSFFMKNAKQKKTSLTPTDLFRLEEIFQEQKWSNISENINSVHLFDRFCKTLDNLEKEEKELLFRVTRNYLWVEFNKYLPLLSKCLSTIDPDELKKFKKIFVVPLLSPDDIGKSKSSTMVAYLLSDTSLKHMPQIGRKQIIIKDNPSNIDNSVHNDDVAIFVTDDFVGTGDTAEAAINHILATTGVDRKKLFIITLVSQKVGHEKICSLGVKHYFAMLRKKGISDNYLNPEKDQYINLMNNIEKRIKVSTSFQLGYKGSEALVTMIRTPNNTFPVFWFENHKKGCETVAPFPRT